MAQKKSETPKAQGGPTAAPDKKHEKALDLAEEALEDLAEGNEKKADRLLEKAKALDPSAPREVARDLLDGDGDPEAGRKADPEH